MNKFQILIFTFLFILTACSSNKDSQYYSMDKKYWDVQDYKLAITQLNFDNSDQKELPNMNDPASAPIFRKIIDTNNISVVASDDQLGVAHKASFTSEMFDQCRNLDEVYSVTDRTDKYKYPEELVEVLKFGLCLQLYYIKNNNGKILKEADNPQDPEVMRVIHSNENILISNFNLYLDYINREDQLTPAALQSFASGIDYYFTRLANTEAPNGDYSSMIEKVDNMLKKTQNDHVRNALNQLSVLLKNKQH